MIYGEQYNICTLQVKKKRTIVPVTLELPVYIAGERVGPPMMKPLEMDFGPLLKEAQINNLMWFRARQVDTTNQNSQLLDRIQYAHS